MVKIRRGMGGLGKLPLGGKGNQSINNNKLLLL